MHTQNALQTQATRLFQAKPSPSAFLGTGPAPFLRPETDGFSRQPLGCWVQWGIKTTKCKPSLGQFGSKCFDHADSWENSNLWGPCKVLHENPIASQVMSTICQSFEDEVSFCHSLRHLPNWTCKCWLSFPKTCTVVNAQKCSNDPKTPGISLLPPWMPVPMRWPRILRWQPWCPRWAHLACSPNPTRGRRSCGWDKKRCGQLDLQKMGAIQIYKDMRVAGFNSILDLFAEPCWCPAGFFWPKTQPSLGHFCPRDSIRRWTWLWCLEVFSRSQIEITGLTSHFASFFGTMIWMNLY